MRSQQTELLHVIEAPREFPEDTRLWEHPFLVGVREALDRRMAGVILDLAHTTSLGPDGPAALVELATYAGFVGGVILLQNVSDGLASVLRAAGVDRVCFIRLAGAPDEASRVDAPTANGDPHALEREARRTTGGILRLEGPDTDAAP